MTLDSGNLLTQPLQGILYGASATGKSTQLALTLNDSLFVTSAASVLRPFASWCREHWDEAKKLGIRTPIKPNPGYSSKMDEDPLTNPKFVRREWTEGGIAQKSLPEFMPDIINNPRYNPKMPEDPIGNPRFIQRRADNWGALKQILYLWGIACMNERNGGPKVPYAGLVLDEGSTFFERVYTNIQESGRFVSPKSQELNMFACMDEIEEFVFYVFEVGRTSGKSFWVVAHELEMAFENNKQKKTYGEMKWLGGPSMPLGRLMAPVCARVDVVLRAVNEKKATFSLGGTTTESVSRYYQTQTDDKWMAKFRDFAIEPRIEPNLRKALKRAGVPIYGGVDMPLSMMSDSGMAVVVPPSVIIPGIDGAPVAPEDMNAGLGALGLLGPVDSVPVEGLAPSVI